MNCPNGCGEMLTGEILWVCGWCGHSIPRKSPEPMEPPEMVRVPGGTFFFGSSDGDPFERDHEKPQKEIFLSDYSISLKPVQNGQYMQFIKVTGAKEPAHWKTNAPLGENQFQPVCFVSWHDAMDYCKWLSDKEEKEYSLPTEAQWEKAARGGIWLDGDNEKKITNPIPERIFPCGNDINPENGNFNGLIGKTTPAGSFKGGLSPYGCVDMSGNVSEWCLDTYKPDSHLTIDPINPIAKGEGKKVLKGGSWRSEKDHIRCSNRYMYDPDRCSYGIGFRIVCAEI